MSTATRKKRKRPKAKPRRRLSSRAPPGSRPRSSPSHYEIVYGLLDAVEYGVPQFRCRFLAMGTRRDLWHCDGVLASLPKPQCFSDPDLAILRDLEGRPLFRSELDLLTHAPGIRYFPDRKLLIPPKPIRQNGPTQQHARSKSFQEFYAKLRRDEPDRIVDAPQGGCE